MTDAATIESGKAAWQRLRHDRRGFDEWVAVGRALQIGKTMALKAAKTNRPVGSRYNFLMGAWLAANGLDGIAPQERYRAILIVENLPAIESWRDGLDPTKVRRLNHPNAIVRHWKNEMTPKKPPDPRKSKSERHSYGKAIHWPQTVLQRAAAAVREARSNDCIILAKAALSAAIRNEVDLLELLPDPPKPAAPPRQTAAPVALELTA